MKKNSEWYLLLPETYRMKAIQNAEREDVLGMKASSLAASLFAFPWESTREGKEYWQDIYNRAIAGEFD